MTTTSDRALGALTGLALADALGMPTQSMSRDRIADTYGPITGLVDAVDDQPIAPGMPAGAVTDDTEQALLVAELLIEGDGHLEPRAFADALAEWERGMAAKGSLDLLGPSTKAAIAAIAAGTAPEEAGKRGTTNGAAMRITPIGIAFGPDPSLLLPAVIEATRVTHNTGLGIAGAAAVAAAVSAGIDGADAAACTDAAAALADAAASHGAWIAGGSIGPRIRWATAAVADLADDAALDFVADVVGTSVASQESVPAAFAMASRFGDDPWGCLCRIASLGGDTDTLGAMAGAILGARHGMAAWPRDAVAQVTDVNHLDLPALTARLLALRARSA